MRVRLHWRFGLADDICHSHIVCISSAGGYVIRMSSAGGYIIRMSSAALLMVTVDLNYLSTLTGTGFEWNLSQECLVFSFQDHINDLQHNLC